MSQFPSFYDMIPKIYPRENSVSFSEYRRTLRTATENYSVTASVPNLQKYFHSYLSFACYLILCLGPLHLMAKEVMIPIGVVLDLNSPIGSMANSCIWMAYHDFYKQYPRFQTRLDLRTKDSDRDTVTAAYTASHLMNEKVHAIIGPQRSGQARYVIELGREHNVPIISFSATSPSLSPSRSKIFIRTAQDDSSQVKAIAAIVEAYGWREIILIYEDTEYGNGLIPYLTDALKAVDTRVPYRSVIDPKSEEPQILEELKKLKHNSSGIFLVHMTAEHGLKLFSAAQKAGMMREGYAWIVTEGLSVKLDPTGPEGMDSMQGVLGLRPKIDKTKRLEDFKKRWKALSVKENIKSPLTFFGLWAYDTVWALAMAVEAQIANSTDEKQNVTLLNTILATKFPGLSGYFSLTGGQLEPSVLEVFNVVGHKERVIGYWSPERRLFRDDQSNIAQDKEKLKQPIWPGYTTVQPPKLRIWVPVRKGFTEFLKLENKSPDNTAKFSGFVVDLFLEVVNVLPFPLSYEFIPLENSNYDEFLTQQIRSRKVDAVVGDLTIVYYRTNKVDFTLPYSESGVKMVVSMKPDQRRNMWIFLKPLSLGLWLTTGAAFVLTGFVVWFLERRSNADFRGTPDQELGMIFWFSFSTLVFAHRERLVNHWSRLVLIVWVFVVLIITQSYTASLASMLATESLQPAFIDINEIKNNNYFVGYQNESFVKDLLINQLGFSESQLKAYNTAEEYHEALSNGTNNGGVVAIFDESPYIKLFLTKYGSRYGIVGPTYKTDGLAFAFPLKSPLVSYFSRAILNVTEDKDKFERIKKKYFSSEIILEDQSASITSVSQSLTVYSFAGLFIVTVVASLLSLSFYLFSFLYSEWPTLRTIHSEQTTFWSMVIQTIKHFDSKDSSLYPPMDRIESRVHPAASPNRDGSSQIAGGVDKHSTTHSHSEEDDVVILNEDNPIHFPLHSNTCITHRKL